MSRLHLIGFPHTRLDQDPPTCAYTAKVQKMRRMDLGRELVVYGTEGADVMVLDESERLRTYGVDDPNRQPLWPTDEQWMEFNVRCIAALAPRIADGDMLLLAGGWSQKVVADAIATLGLEITVCEPGVGYEGIVADFCAFESAAWRHHVYGLKGIRDGRWMDAVIPNYFDVDEFSYANDDGGDYLLFVGRVTLRKGVEVAAAIARAAGSRLVIAGPGAAIVDGKLVGDYVTFDADNVEYVGPVGPADRAELMAGARALVAPTLYVEPFGGVAVEAMLCGTPVIASDFGAFTETVENGVTGQRFTNVQEAVDALAVCDTLAAETIRARAVERYSLEAVAPMFRDWFARLDLTRVDGSWYATREPLDDAAVLDDVRG